MSKIITRVVLFIIALAMIFLFLLKGRSPFGKSNSSFASEPINEITKIEFEQKGGKLILEKAGDKWLINGKTEARKSSILFIERVLMEMAIKSPVSTELFEKVVTSQDIEPVRVKVFEKRKLLKTFLVYKTGSNVYGNIMKMRENSKPFILSVPGYEGDIGSGFTLKELFWQPYTVYNLLPSQIASVAFENMTDSASSFLITIRNQQYTLSDMKRNLTGWDTALLTRYLTYFVWIPFESWPADTEDIKEKLKSQQPVYRITVTTTEGIIKVLSLWEKMIWTDDKQVIDTDRLYGRVQDIDEYFIMRYFDIDPIIKKRSYFFRE